MRAACRALLIRFVFDYLFIALHACHTAVNCTGLISTFAVHSSLLFLILSLLSLQWGTTDANNELQYLQRTQRYQRSSFLTDGLLSVHFMALYLGHSHARWELPYAMKPLNNIQMFLA